MAIDFSILQPAPPPQTQEIAAQAPAGGGGDNFLSGITGLLGGLQKVFGANPVSTANSAMNQTMQSTDPRLISNNMMPRSVQAQNPASPVQQPRLPPSLNNMQSPQANILQQLKNGNQMKQPNQAPTAPQMPHPVGFMENTVSMLKKFEGYLHSPKWDINAYRAGYGSDTATRANGVIEKIRPGMQVSREDAERDLARRTNDFASATAQQVGVKQWSSLPANAQAGLTSVAYNYGSLPKRLMPAVKSGDVSEIARAVKGLASDNDGINKSRRYQEANIIENGFQDEGPVMKVTMNGMPASPGKPPLPAIPAFNSNVPLRSLSVPEREAIMRNLHAQNQFNLPQGLLG